MYRPAANRVDDLPVAVAMIREHGVGHLVVAGAGGLESVPVPVLIDDPADPDAIGPDGAGLHVRAHVARANPIWRAAPCPAMLIVSPVDAYVSPAYYPSKQVDPRVVPTWNYELVHVHGTVRAHTDPASARVVRDLTARHESGRAVVGRRRAGRLRRPDAARHRRHRPRGSQGGGEAQAQPEPLEHRHRRCGPQPRGGLAG